MIQVVRKIEDSPQSRHGVTENLRLQGSLPMYIRSPTSQSRHGVTSNALTFSVPMSQIVLDKTIYPRLEIYAKRVSMFAENMRDGFEIDPIEVQIHPDDDIKYRILDGAHGRQVVG